MPGPSPAACSIRCPATVSRTQARSPSRAAFPTSSRVAVIPEWCRNRPAVPAATVSQGEKSSRSPDQPRPGAVEERPRLDAFDRRRGGRRPRGESGGRQPVPGPVRLDGADAPLRAARGRLPRRSFGPRRRQPLHLPLPRPEARRDRRLRRTREDDPGVRRGRHVRQANRRPAGGGRLGAKRRRVHRRPAARRALRRPSRPPDAAVASNPAGPLLHDGRQPQPFLRLARLGHRAARESRSARCSSPTGRSAGSATRSAPSPRNASGSSSASRTRARLRARC